MPPSAPAGSGCSPRWGRCKAHQTGLMSHLTGELHALRHVTVIGDAMRRVPVLAFTVAGRKGWEVVQALADTGVCVCADPGHHGVFATLGVAEVGGAVRVGLAHYTTTTEINALIHALS